MNLLRSCQNRRRWTDSVPAILLGALAAVGMTLYVIQSVAEYQRVPVIRADEILVLALTVIAVLAVLASMRVNRLTRRSLQTERALRELELRYRYLFESAPVGMAVSSFDGRVLEVNETLVLMHGYESKAEFMRSSVADRFCDPKDRERWVAAVWDTGKADGLEVRAKHRDGSPFWTSTTVKPLATDTGEQQLVAVVQDISARKSAEMALQITAEKLKAVVENAPIGIAVSDADKRFVSANEAFCRTLGYTEVELQNMSFIDITHPDDIQASSSNVDDLDVGKTTNFVQEKRYVRKGGKVIVGRVSVTVVRDASGKPSYHIAQVEDVTERKQAEAALFAERENFRNSLELSPFGIQIITNEGELVHSNRTMLNMWGFGTFEELKATPRTERFTPDSIVTISEKNESVKRGEIPSPYEVSIVCRNGTKLDLQVHSKEIVWNGERLVQMLYEDVTVRKQAAAALQAERENLRNSMEMSPLGIQIVKPSGELVYANKTMLEMWGYNNLAELKAVPLEMRFTPESIATIRGNVRLNKEGGAILPHELTLIRRNGEIRHLLAHPKEVTWDGQARVQTLYQDITERKQAEALYRTLADSSPTGVYIVQNREFVFTNPAFKTATGYTKSDLAARDSLSLVHPEDRSQTRDNAIPMLRGETVQPYEFRYITKSGETRWAVERVSSTVYQGKRATLGTFMDITDMKQADQVIARQRAYFQQLFDNSPDAIALLDTTDRIVDVNKGFESLFGYVSEETKGRFINDLIIPEGSLDEASGLSQTVLKGETVRAETVRRRRDGSLLDVSAVGYPINVGGKMAGVYVIYSDITERKQAGEALKESERKYRDLVDNAPVGISVSSIDGRVIEVNRTLPQMHGMSKEEFMKSPVSARFHDPDDRKRFVALAQRMGKVDGFEVRTKRKDGSLFWTSITSIPRTTETGEQQLITVSQDISERKLAEEALMFKTTLLEAQAESTIEGILVVNDESRIVLCNGRFREMWHLPESLLQSNDNRAVLNHTASLLDDSESFLQRVQHLNGHREEHGQDVLDLKDGRVIIRDSSPLVDADGTYRGRAWYFRDITEPRRMTERLEHAAEEWRMTFDSITDLISLHDKNNVLVRVNRAFANKLDTTPANLIGKTCHEVMHGAHSPPNDCPARKTLETGKPAAIETFEPHREIWLQESTYPICGDQGEVVGTVHIVKDVTELKQMGQQLMMTDRLASIGELVSGIAHELNNPLTGVIGFSELLMERDVADDIKEELSIVASEAHRAARIVKDLLTFARKHTPVKQASQINNIIEDVLRLRAYEHNVNNIEVVRHLAPDLPEITADYFQIQQVFLNIITNAEFFMIESHNRGTLTVTTERVDAVIRISFADDGPGIPEENLSRIFNPFFTTKEVGKGTGLGMSICHGIVTEHGGRICARSELGQGATFVVELPIDEPTGPGGTP